MSGSIKNSISRKKYHKPQLQELGDLRTLTLGGSPGLLDSGSSTIRKPPGSLPQPDMFPPTPNGMPGPGMPPIL